MKTLAIIGSGHLGQQIAHLAIADKHFENIVFFDDFSTEKKVLGYDVLGKTSEVEAAFENNQFDEILIGIGYNHLPQRQAFFEKLSQKIPFATLIHSSVWKDETATVKSGCVIYPGCVIDARAQILENTIVNLSNTIAHDSVIGAHSFLSPSAAVAGFVTIGAQSVIGINATIIDNISIVPQTRIGGGSVVIKNIEKSGLYVGNPCKFVR